MRLTTKVCAKFESKGKPECASTLIDREVGLVAKELLLWLSEHAMGHYIKVTIARTESELERYSKHGGKSKSQLQGELLGDFEKALAELGYEADSDFAIGEEPFAPPADKCGRCGFTAADCDCPENER